jgi:hypothetical protein
MSLLEGFNKIRLVKVGPSLRQRIERWIAAAHHKAMVSRLHRFREGLERDMKPEPWTVLEAPMPLIIADLCDALGLDERERATVLGVEGALALADTLETAVRPVPSPHTSVNERQAKALRYVREHGEINMGIYRQICPHWSEETLRLDLANLVRRKLLIKNGSKRGTRYVLAE